MTEKNIFVRNLYNKVFHEHNNGKFGSDTSKYYTRSDKHDGFWYCVDVCWSNLNEVDLVVCLYQVFFHTTELHVDDKIESEIRNNTIEYLRNNLEDFEIKLKEYNDRESVDLLNNQKDWWNHFG